MSDIKPFPPCPSCGETEELNLYHYYEQGEIFHDSDMDSDGEPMAYAGDTVYSKPVVIESFYMCMTCNHEYDRVLKAKVVRAEGVDWLWELIRDKETEARAAGAVGLWVDIKALHRTVHQIEQENQPDGS